MEYFDSILAWAQAHKPLATLISLMFVDSGMGILAAIGAKKLNSSVSWRGMTKKAGILLIVATGALFEPHLSGLPLGGVLSVFYAATEGISVVENASRLGIPIPKTLVEALSKLRNETPPMKIQVITDDGKKPQGE